MGNPIYKTSMNKANDYDPEYTKVYRSTSTTMVELSRALNSLTGGDDVKRGTSFNPATWQNILLDIQEVLVPWHWACLI